MGACLLLTGIVAAVVSAPLFDRVFTHHLALTIKILIPIVAGAWVSLIWAGMITCFLDLILFSYTLYTVTPHNIGGLFAIMTILGVGSITVLPMALELGCELTSNANTSAALLWFS
jgi:FLVCR family MFS transporter 7